jgi:hypothetical protein
MRERTSLLYDGNWTYHRHHDNVMAQEAVPASLLSFTNFWLKELGLNGKKCLLTEDGEGLPFPFSGSMRLYREDGTCLELDTVAKPLDPDHPYVQEVRAGNYDLIVISIAGWCLREGGAQSCPRCGHADHTVLQHTILHELVHVAFPEYSAHNEWTDNKVDKLLERVSGSNP